MAMSRRREEKMQVLATFLHRGVMGERMVYCVQMEIKKYRMEEPKVKDAEDKMINIFMNTNIENR